MKKVGLLISLPLVLALSGCVISIGGGDSSEWGNSWKKTQDENRQAIARLNIGDSRDRVLSILGEPSFSESFSQDSKIFQVYYFRTHRTHGDGETTRDETTPVVFLNGKLTGWGDNALNTAMNISG